MQPSRPHSSTGDTQSHVPRSLPSSSFLSSGSAPGHSQTILPSIRQLHPYLPPAGIPAPMALSEGQTHFPGPRGGDVGYALHESEPDELEQQGPPKKKRRRQALSCTECKRRKIKCDRSQPCAPCTRRGEQAKCHWHVVEPVEKYVTRQEFDDLKTRFDELATLVHQYMPLNSPARQLSRHHMLPGPSTPEAMHSYHLGYPVYQPAPPPVQAYHHSGSLSASPQVPPPPPIQRHERIGSPHLRSPIGAHVTSTASPPLNLRSRSPLSSSLRHRVTDSMESTTNTITTICCLTSSKGLTASFTCIDHIALCRSRTAVKKLPSADAQPGRASAHPQREPERPSSYTTSSTGNPRVISPSGPSSAAVHYSTIPRSSTGDTQGGVPSSARPSSAHAHTGSTTLTPPPYPHRVGGPHATRRYDSELLSRREPRR
ncbi:hypothetical protein APHAL10511_008728 [Amanita phalloides]|nr:hypothetical protein APHAL10511_008728 [Amanita phalloides]